MSNASTVLRQFGPMVYLPTILFALGEGAVLPLIPVIAANMGADVASAALVAAALVVGQLCGNLPAGWAVARIGERFTMVIAGVISMVAVAGMILAPAIGLFAAAVFLLGFCAAAFGLARHAFMTTRVPIVVRARALSLLGGSFRLGIFVGPFITAGLLQIFADERASIWFFLGCLLLMVALVLFGPDPEQTTPPLADSAALSEDSGEAVSGSIPTIERHGVFRTMWLYRGVLGRLGLAAASLSAVR
jgi:MFS family permease